MKRLRRRFIEINQENKLTSGLSYHPLSASETCTVISIHSANDSYMVCFKVPAFVNDPLGLCPAPHVAPERLIHSGRINVPSFQPHFHRTHSSSYQD